MRGKSLTLWTAAAALAASAAWSVDASREVFANGLTAIVAEDHAHPVATVRVYVKAGSIYEDPYLGAGISHYIEHLLGEGTEKYTKEEMTAAVAEMGGAYNAYTWKDQVCYHIAVRADKVDQAIEHMAERVFRSTLPPASVANQRDIIVNEIRMGRDEPSRVLQKGFFRTAFREHPARYPVIGYEELFTALSRDDVFDYYRRYYVPARAVVVVAGDVDTAATFATLRATFGALPRGKPVAEEPFVEPPQLGRRDVVVPMDIEAAYLWLGFRAPPLGSKDADALELAAAIAGQGRSSRLYRRVLQEEGYVTDISAWLSTPPSGAGYLAVYAEGEAMELNYAEDAIVAEMLNFAEKPVSRAELARAKKLLAAQRILGLQTVEDVAADLGENELYTGNMNYGDESLARLAAITADDVRAAARRYIRESNMTVAKVVPRDWAAAAVPGPGRRPPGPMTELTLDNGVRLLIREDAAAGAVNVRGVIAGGSRVAAPGKEGVAELAAELLVKGTKKRDAERIAREVEDLGASLSAAAGLDYLTLAADCLGEDFEKIFDVYADCLTNAVVPETEFTREQDRLVAQVQSEDDDWELQAEKLMRQALYPKHPYRYRTTGTADTVARITREDVVAYYQKYVTPANVVIAVVGDVAADEVARVAAKKLGKWRPPEAPAPLVPTDPPPADEVDLTQKTDNEQAVIYFGFAGISYGDGDEFPLRLLDAALSGVYLPGGRLHERLRGAGLVYVVHAYDVIAQDPGYFAIFAATAPDKAADALAAIEEEVAKIKAEPITAEELALAKENWLTMDALYNRQSNGDAAALAARDELVGLGFDWRDNFAARVRAVTAADVTAAARKYLVNPVVVVTSPAAAEEETAPAEPPAPE